MPELYADSIRAYACEVNKKKETARQKDFTDMLENVLPYILKRIKGDIEFNPAQNKATFNLKSMCGLFINKDKAWDNDKVYEFASILGKEIDSRGFTWAYDHRDGYCFIIYWD